VRTEHCFVTIEPARLSRILASASLSGGFFATLWAALVASLFHWTGARDFVVGTLYANRDRPETFDLIGCFINFLVIRIKIVPDETLGRLRSRLYSELLDAFDHAELPYTKVIEAVRPTLLPGRNPMCNVVLQLEQASASEVDSTSPTISAVSLQLSEGPDRVDLRLYVKHAGESVEIDFRYDAQRFERRTIEALARRYLDTIELLVEDPNRPLTNTLLPAGSPLR
jgi:non-ribosomal peptide synthetase component F